MTRFEYLKNASIEEMAEVLCNISDNTICAEKSGDCEACLANKYCKKGHTGFIDWLSKEVEFSKNTKDVIVWE